MLRAFYQDMENFSDEWSMEVRKNLGCYIRYARNYRLFQEQIQLLTQDKTKQAQMFRTLTQGYQIGY